MKCFLQQFNRITRFEQDGFNVFLEFGPTGKAVFTSDDELSIVQAERSTEVRMNLSHAIHGSGFISDELFEEIFGLILELLKTRPRRERL